MCPPGYRTLTSTAGPRIRKTSCCGCSERKSTWLPPGGLCPRCRWYPCDTPAQAPGARPHLDVVLAGTLLAEAGWQHSQLFVFSPLLRGSPTPESLFCSLFFPLDPHRPCLWNGRRLPALHSLLLLPTACSSEQSDLSLLGFSLLSKEIIEVTTSK